VPDAPISIRCRVNGTDATLHGHPLMRLLDALRSGLHLTGTKEGCGEGECGACAISLDGRLVNSCLVPLLHADGSVIVTIEGVAQGERLHAVQEAFISCGGAQCGICTPGMILAAVTLLERTPNPGEQEVREALAGNLCRCTGYVRIFEAVLGACRTAGSSACGPREESDPSTSSGSSRAKSRDESSSAAARASGGGAPRALNK
jgi:aerobic carbon-monoxide dehydrogenase small subunit